MNKVCLNTIPLNNIPMNIVGEIPPKSNTSNDEDVVDIPIGVYILTIDNKFYTAEEWDTANNDKVVGISINNGEHNFVIATKQVTSSYFDELINYYPEFDYSNNLIAIDNKDDALLDFDGENNTKKILEVQKLSNSRVTIVEMCATYEFINGRNGYMLALGEVYMLYENFTDLNNLLRIVGGTRWNSGKRISSSTIGAVTYGVNQEIDRVWAMDARTPAIVPIGSDFKTYPAFKL